MANFAYDPINFAFMKKLNIVELFLDCLDEEDEKLKGFGMAGISNCCGCTSPL